MTLRDFASRVVGRVRGLFRPSPPNLFDADYAYRECPLPRPISTVSLGEAFAWFFPSESFLPSNPQVNAVAGKCRNDPAYSGAHPGRILWSAERETAHAAYCILRLLRPRNVTEIGIYNGATSVCLAQALHDNGQGHLHCIELDPYHASLAQEHLEEAGLDALVTVHQGSSHDLAMAARIPPCEFIFVDGDHSYDGAKRDFELYSQRLVPRGMMLYHDTTKIMALRRLMKEIADSGQFDALSIGTSDGDGITLLRKRT